MVLVISILLITIEALVIFFLLFIRLSKPVKPEIVSSNTPEKVAAFYNQNRNEYDSVLIRQNSRKAATEYLMANEKDRKSVV